MELKKDNPKTMNPGIKKRWLEALRSGEYKQGRSFLRAKDKNGDLRHCCLGVLTDLFVNDHVGTRWYEEDKDQFTRRVSYEFDGAEDYPSERVWRWAGLSESSPIVILKKKDPFGYIQKSDLASLNDDRKTFSTIAKYIEEQL